MASGSTVDNSSRIKLMRQYAQGTQDRAAYLNILAPGSGSSQINTNFVQIPIQKTKSCSG